MLGYDADDPDRPSALDSAAHVPRSLVVDPAFDWGDDDRRPRRYADTVIYEVHVKGFTMAHPDVPAELRGHLRRARPRGGDRPPVDLGVTAVELLPVHQNVPEAFLAAAGLTNYWGYNTIGFFAPHDGYSAAVRAGRPGGQVAEFKAMVDTLHAAGLEVLLDVVYNHTAEGDHRARRCATAASTTRRTTGSTRPTRSRYLDTTGCGNSLNAGDPSPCS